MRRHVAGDAEVVDRLHQPLAEQMLPDAIDHHPRGERILRAGQPLGQFQPAALLGVDRRLRRRSAPRSRSRGERPARAFPPRRGCGSRCRRRSWHRARPAPSARWPAGSLSSGQLGLQLVHLLAGGRAFGRPSAVCRLPCAIAVGASNSSRRLRQLPSQTSDLLGGRGGAAVPGPAATASAGRNSPGRRRPSCCAAPAHRSRAVKDAGQGVIVGRRDRVELVIVAAGAARRQRQHRPRHRVDLLVDVVHDEADLEPLVDVLHAQRQEAGGDQMLVPLGRRSSPAAGRRRSARGEIRRTACRR